MIHTITCYHATLSKNIPNIKLKNYDISLNDELWLGDGIYFFYEDIYAFKWGVSLNKKNSDINTKENILSNISILENNIEYDESRIFDLTCIYEQILFDEMYKNFIKKSKKNLNILKNSKNVQGIILNYMFNELNLKENYDIVKQFFRLHRKNYENILPNSISGIPQYQLCVKNPKIIKECKVFPYSEKFDEYLENWRKLINSVSLEELYEIKNIENNNYIMSNNEIYKVGDLND